MLINYFTFSMCELFTWVRPANFKEDHMQRELQHSCCWKTPMIRATLIMPCAKVHASSKMSLAWLHAAIIKQNYCIYIHDLIPDTENMLPSHVLLCDTHLLQTVESTNLWGFVVLLALMCQKSHWYIKDGPHPKFWLTGWQVPPAHQKPAHFANHHEPEWSVPVSPWKD